MHQAKLCMPVLLQHHYATPLPCINFQLKSNSHPAYNRTCCEGNGNFPSSIVWALCRCCAAKQMCATSQVKYAIHVRAVQLGGPSLGTTVCKQTDGVQLRTPLRHVRLLCSAKGGGGGGVGVGGTWLVGSVSSQPAQQHLCLPLLCKKGSLACTRGWEARTSPTWDAHRVRRKQSTYIEMNTSELTVSLPQRG